MIDTETSLDVSAWPTEPASLSGNVIYLFEPLWTCAPGPDAAVPWCCYARTVIFYKRAPDGGYVSSATGQDFEEHDRTETTLGAGDLVSVDGVTFEALPGRILWQGGRWWARHLLHRHTPRPARANGETWHQAWPGPPFTFLLFSWHGWRLRIRLDTPERRWFGLHLRAQHRQLDIGRVTRRGAVRSPWVGVHKSYGRAVYYLLGYGLGVKDRRKRRLYASEQRAPRLGPYVLRFLSPTTLF